MEPTETSTTNDKRQFSNCCSSRRMTTQIAVSLDHLRGKEQASFKNKKPTQNVEDEDIHAIFEMADDDKSGKLSKEDFVSVLRAMKQNDVKSVEREESLKTETKNVKKRLKLGVIVTVALALFLTVSVAGNFAVIFAVVDGQVKTSEERGMITIKGSDNVAQVATAKETIPLGLATYMEQAELLSIDKIMLTKRLFDGATRTSRDVKESYTIIGYEWTSEQRMFFKLHEGGVVRIVDGNAMFQDTPTSLPIEVCTTNMESAQFKVSGVDVNALIAKSNASNAVSHRRALQQSLGSCTDPTPFVAPFMEAFAETFDELRNLAAQMNQSTGGTRRRRLKPKKPDTASRRQLGQLSERHKLQYGIGSHKGGSSIDLYDAPIDATTPECQETKGFTDKLLNNFQTMIETSEKVDEQLETALDSIVDVYELHAKLETANTNLPRANLILKVLGNTPGLGGTLAKVAKTLGSVIETSVNKVHKVVDPFVHDKLKDEPQSIKLEKKIKAVKTKNDDMRARVETAKETFEFRAQSLVLAADEVCGHYTSTAICTNKLNDALTTVNNVLQGENLPPVFHGVTLPDFSNFLDYLNVHNTLLDVISLSSLIGWLNPFYKAMTTKMWIGCCGWWYETSIENILDNWLIKSFSWQVNQILSPLTKQFEKIFKKLGVTLPTINPITIPALTISSLDMDISMDFEAVGLPCLSGRHYRPSFSTSANCLKMPGGVLHDYIPLCADTHLLTEGKCDKRLDYDECKLVAHSYATNTNWLPAFGTGSNTGGEPGHLWARGCFVFYGANSNKGRVYWKADTTEGDPDCSEGRRCICAN